MATTVIFPRAESDPVVPVPRGRRRWGATIRLLVCGGLALLLLASCKQLTRTPQSGGQAAATGSDAVIAGAASGRLVTAPGSLAGSGATPSLQQALAGNQGFATVIDRQGVSWSVEIGQPYDAASGKTCKPLRFVALSRSAALNRVACSSSGTWVLVEALRGGETGPRF
ncbi:MAG: hypothetical protein Kilf2KO_22310 [Rhodospirillales bacterium]